MKSFSPHTEENPHIRDSAILQQIREGSTSAFKQVYEEYSAPLLRYAQSIVKDIALAEDIIQDVFVSVWERRSNLNAESPLAAYLYRAVRNRSINSIQRQSMIDRKVQSFQSQTSEPLSPAFIHGGSTPTLPDTALEESEYNKFLIDAINTLPERRRFAMILKVVHEMDYTHIANAMDISESSARALVTRAREDLKEILKNF